MHRNLPIADPERRLMILSCGAALHHACVALAADGYTFEVERVPADTAPADVAALATITVTGRAPVTPKAADAFRMLADRHTDRRPLRDEAVPTTAIAAMRAAATACGIGMHILTRDDVLELAAATDRAQRDELDYDAARAELDAWTGDGRPAGAGIPDAVIPARPPRTTVPGRDFGHDGSLPISDRHDRAAEYVILYGLEDGPRGWLRGGEALSAVWLEAVAGGVAVVPLSAAVEEYHTRQILRRVLRGLGHPFLGLRIGIADPDAEAPERTPRLTAPQTVEIDAG
jgi:hypothetical protein